MEYDRTEDGNQMTPRTADRAQTTPQVPDWLDVDAMNARARELTGIERKYGEDVARSVALGATLDDARSVSGLYVPPAD